MKLLLASSFFIASLAQAGDIDITNELIDAIDAPAKPAATTTSSPTTAPVLATIEQRVVNEVVKPIHDREVKRSRYSRMRMPPRERQVKATSTTVMTDAKGNRFVPFAIEARASSDSAFRAEKSGCVYIAGDIFVDVGGTFYPSTILTGASDAKAVEGVCVAATPTT